MRPAARLILAGTLLAAAAAGIWTWRDAQHRRAMDRQERWMAYLHGPLSDLLEGSSRGRVLLEQARRKALSAAERQALAAEAILVRNAHAGAKTMAQDWQADAFFEPMLQTLQWHAALEDAASVWVKVAQRQDLIQPALEAEKGLRLNLAAVLDRQRTQIFDAGRIGRERGLEINALLFSLKE